MKILVLGGDGFCGWPTALHLSAHGHDVSIADSGVRRTIDEELGVNSLTPIESLDQRVRAWESVSGRKIGVYNVDIAEEPDKLQALIEREKPAAIVHFAEQRSAPYSMKSAKHKRYTVDNNLNATNNLLLAVVELGLDPHIVHLGSMGVYGYETLGEKIPEGYLNVNGRDVIYPPSPGSVYHTTKAQDQLLFQFYSKNDGLRVTDLHQGIVWGTQTNETKLDERLINRFDYDGDFGTVLNRFLMQGVMGYPLTVHGTGGQTRAFIHIQDTVKCVRLAIENPPGPGERVQIYNQMTETHRVRDLAEMIAERTGVDIDYQENPRKEAQSNDLVVENQSLLSLGLDPITLENGLLEEVEDIVRAYMSRCDTSKIPCTSRW
jgi:UDP-sulfoquinovose synthase